MKNASHQPLIADMIAALGPLLGSNEALDFSERAPSLLREVPSFATDHVSQQGPVIRHAQLAGRIERNRAGAESGSTSV